MTHNLRTLVGIGMIVSLMVFGYSLISFTAFRDQYIIDTRLDPVRDLPLLLQSVEGLLGVALH